MASRIPTVGELFARWRTDDASVVVQNEAAIALIYVGGRCGVELSVLMGALTGVRVTTHLLAYVTLTACSLAVAVAVGVMTLRARRPPRPALGWCDLAFAALCIPALVWCVPSNDLIGRWSYWAPGMAMLVATSSVATLRAPAAATASGAAMAVVYVATLSLTGSRDWASLAANAISYLLMAGVASALWAYLRSIAERADAFRLAAVEATRQAERERYRSVVHDASGLLRMLSEGPESGALREVLLAQASQEATKLRRYLAEESSASPGQLGDVIRRACDCFTDLPIEFNVQLGQAASIGDRRVRDALEAAIETVLHNVRRHAAASEVVIHADLQDGAWTVVIRDDGRGFDPATRHHGYGLDVQLGSALARHGINSTIASTPGRGTAITLRGHEIP
ncbi:MAG TPA: hypothetical protein H9987_03825 [Candidatus Luteococcus avicola]|nr:hypothetical protein [Candidatus Luteococcus avicola]